MSNIDIPMTLDKKAIERLYAVAKELKWKETISFFESSNGYNIHIEKRDRYTYVLTKANKNIVIETLYLSFKTELDASKLESIIFYSNHRVDDTEEIPCLRRVIKEID